MGARTTTRTNGYLLLMRGWVGPCTSSISAFTSREGQHVSGSIIPVATIILAVVVTPFPQFTFSPLLVAISAAKVFLPLVCLVKFVPPVPCLSAIVAMVFNGLMQLPMGVGNPSVTIVPVIGSRPRRRCKKGQRAQHNPRRYPS